ncbi:T-lymphocyte surface antigen Ly-9-like [Ranitomeya variabilis]|uniref:T-lymphocyte surface antigen Ly-9-like n=1 Tax=Ranitomeya variabilis TaxID=490064 RepID=UPI004057A29F
MNIMKRSWVEDISHSIEAGHLRREDRGRITQEMVVLLLLLMPAWGVLSDTTRQTLSAKFGGSILFQVNIPKNTEITSVFWSHMQKMVAIDKSDHLNVINPRFLKRLTSQQPSFSLKLSNLTEEDSGIYEAKIYTNGPTIERSFKLQVCGKYQTCGVQWTKSSIQLIIILGTLATFFNAMT